VSEAGLALSASPTDFRHEALVYDGEAEFVHDVSSFIKDGLSQGEPALVVVGGAKIDRLLDALGGDSRGVEFADMADVGSNPARIIPAWRDFVSKHEGSRLRGVGEPIWAERGGDELVECQVHESLLNVAFADVPSFWLLCPYDSSTLTPGVLDEARRSHPFLRRRADSELSDAYRAISADVLSLPLPAPAAGARELAFDAHSLAWVRALVRQEAARSGLPVWRITDLVQAANEVATNSVRHGGGRGVVRVWQEPDALVCEVWDTGHYTDPLADRERPGENPHSSRGLWLVNQLCDLVQVRSSAGAGCTVRLRVRRS
jgi:anti-sigma regulatory factor (Ser/Thr protein kinase)